MNRKTQGGGGGREKELPLFPLPSSFRATLHHLNAWNNLAFSSFSFALSPHPTPSCVSLLLFTPPLAVFSLLLLTPPLVVFSRFPAPSPLSERLEQARKRPGDEAAASWENMGT